MFDRFLIRKYNEKTRSICFGFFAVRTGLEPATPGVTGRYSNQLNYRTIVQTLCVFVERGCKGTHFFYISKLFCDFLQKKVAMAGITLAIAWCSESENSIFRMGV